MHHLQSITITRRCSTMTEPMEEYKEMNTMESVKVRIDGDADAGFKFTAVAPAIQ